MLYRTNAQSRKIEDAFLQGRVPYQIYSGTSFYQREEIKDMLCYLRLAVNLYDEESLRRVINKPARGIGDTTVGKLLKAAAMAEIPVWQVIEEETCPDLNAGTTKKLKDFRDMMTSFHESASTDDAYTLALRIVRESGLQAYIFSGHDPEDVSRQENLQEMMDGIAAFVSNNREQGLGVQLSDYLQMASLATDMDRNKMEKDADLVNMMTIHSAKGLEFPVVFIAGLEEGLFPSELSAEEPRALEEERRLFYVALTRAERQVVLTFAKSRFRNGKMEFSRPSRFIREIPQQFYKDSQSASRDFKSRIEQRMKPIRPQNISSSEGMANSKFINSTFKLSGGQSPSAPLSRPLVQENIGMSGDLKVGSSVVHERFGCGVVQALEGTGIDAKATVHFENAGTKVLMLRFAKLTVQ